MITLMVLTALGTATYIVFGVASFLIRVFGRAFGVVLGLATLIPVVFIFLIGAGITFMPFFFIAALLVAGGRWLVRCR